MNARFGGHYWLRYWLRYRLLAVLLLLLVPASARAFEGRLVLPGGAPASGYQVSVVGLTVSVTAGPDGRFRILPTPAVPFRLVFDPGELERGA